MKSLLEPPEEHKPAPVPAPVQEDQPKPKPSQPAPKEENPSSRKVSNIEQKQEPAHVNSSNNSEFQLLSVTELRNYHSELSNLKTQITADKVDLQTLMHFEKPEFSCQFMEMYEPILSQQSDHFRAKEDVKSAQRCNDLEIETAKKMKQIQKYIESGKLSLQDYYNAIEVELNKLIGATKFVKTHMNNPKVLNFLVNKTKIVSKEVKEIKEMLAQQS
jgi:hypothetical protein